MPNRGNVPQLTPAQLDKILDNQQQQIAVQQQQLQVQVQQIALQDKQLDNQRLEIETNKDLALASIDAQKTTVIDDKKHSRQSILIGIIGFLIFALICFAYGKSDLITNILALAGAFLGGWGWNIYKGNK